MTVYTKLYMNDIQWMKNSWTTDTFKNDSSADNPIHKIHIHTGLHTTTV